MNGVSDDVWRAYRRAYWRNLFAWSLGAGAAALGMLAIGLSGHAHSVRDAQIFVAITVAVSYVLYSIDVRAIRARHLGK